MQKLTGKKARNRRILGIISIIIMIIGVFAINHRKDPREYQYKFEILTNIVYVWFAFSLANKLLMIFNRYCNKIVIVSLFLYIATIVVIGIVGTKITSYQIPVIYELFTTTWLTVWPLIDVCDLCYHFLYRPS